MSEINGIDDNMLLNKKERDYIYLLLESIAITNNEMIECLKLDKAEYKSLKAKLNYFTK